MTEPVPSFDRYSRIPALVAWLVILLCVGFVMSRVARAYRRAAAEGMVNPGAELQVQFAGKSAVGLRELFADESTTKPSTTKTPATQPSAADSPFRQNVEQMIAAMDKDAATDLLKTRTIIVVGEVHGAEAALTRLDELEKSKPAAATEEDLWSLRQIYNSAPEALDAAQRQRLIDRHGYFGKLALSYGLPDKDASRVALLSEAKRTAICMFVAGGLFLIVMILALAAVVTAIVLAATGYLRPLFAPTPSANSAFLEAFAIYLAAFIGLSFALHLLKAEALAWEWLALILIPIIFAYIRWRGVSAADMRRGLGWYWGRGPLIEIPLGIFGYLAGIPVIALGMFISFRISKAFNASPMHPLQQMLEGGVWHTVGLYLLVSLYAPVIEETMFRGALLNHLRRRWNWPISVSIVALVFASIHPQGWTFIPALGSIAIVLAAIREWRGSLWAPIAAHATNNFIVLSLALMAAR